MRLFFWINGLAGHSAVADTLLRGVYVSAVPLLWMALAGVLVLLPRQDGAPSRRKVAIGAVLGAIACLLLMAGINSFARQVFNTPVLCDRPFVTRRVTLLLIEPNDNSFPSPEVMLAACAAFALSVAAPRRGWLSWLMVALLGWARVFCGSNFIADAIAGILLGGASGGLCLAMCRATWRIPSSEGFWRWRARRQAALCSFAMVATLLSALYVFGSTPRYRPRLATLFGSPATAAPTTQHASALAPMLAAQTLRMRTGALNTLREGEGSSATNDEPPTDPTFPDDRTLTGGNLPDAEAHLLHALKRLHLPHRLVSVDVAQVRAGNTPYRAAAVRFEVQRRGPLERRLVAATAAAIVRAGFRADPQLSNIDVLGVMLNVEDATSNSSQDEDSRPALAGGVLPVFTASVERSAAQRPPYERNAGTWLSRRSLLYIDSKQLPPVAPTPRPTATPTPRPTPTLPPPPTASPTLAPPPTPTMLPTMVRPTMPRPTVPRPTTARPTMAQPTIARPTSVPTVSLRPTVPAFSILTKTPAPRKVPARPPIKPRRAHPVPHVIPKPPVVRNPPAATRTRPHVPRFNKPKARAWPPRPSSKPMVHHFAPVRPPAPRIGTSFDRRQSVRALSPARSGERRGVYRSRSARIRRFNSGTRFRRRYR